MKRFVSLVLSVCFLFSINTVSYAANTSSRKASNPVIQSMTNVLTAFSCQRTFVIFYLLNSDITGGVVHNYAFSCIYRHIGCR